ncbi:methylthioribose-1-phosphate isomerase [Galendromus occidentalis]|uniref:Methylthioribose-1-phosphate isomerase n=1 Tax=Galendromus occidentalis TaxID=34638 RepID=A0AAJ6QRC7_9ACAR|nr:methylthioribose-1-phosphate isomerase [Galendromus occidentalis]
MADQGAKCSAIFYERGSLRILDQLSLPEKTEMIQIRTIDDAWNAINKMQVRGAPAIAIVGVLSVAVLLERMETEEKAEIHREIVRALDHLVTSRPTAVNMKNAAEEFKALSSSLLNDVDTNGTSHRQKIIEAAEDMYRRDVETNKSLARFGAEYILRAIPAGKVNVLTVCNTGSLATAGYGTALGVIRKLHEENRLETAYFTETRPYNQGERLTAYELATEGIPSMMICDNMVSFLMKKKQIHAVVVGADRVTSNGDTANKIGTYQAAIAAKYHKVPFLVACPSTTIDVRKSSGDEIPIEERAASEVSKRIRTPCWNPAFDVTPNELVTAIVTERGAFEFKSNEWKQFVATCEGK